jgi:glycosyltransferase involved in cell wall biosynthesis
MVRATVPVRLLVIIPAFNEQAALGGVLGELGALRSLPGVELDTVVVDDGSADRTPAVAREHGARLVRLCRNLGIGGAVQAGLMLAHREGFDFAVQLDGDGQHPPGELGRLIAAARQPEAPDLVIGTRYRTTSGGFRSTALRRLGSWWLRLLLRTVTRVRVSDPTSGFRIYSARSLRLFADTYPYDFPEPEAIALARAAGLRVAEVAVTMRERQGGQSSISGYKSMYYMLKVTVAVLLTYLRSRGRPARGEARDAAA